MFSKKRRRSSRLKKESEAIFRECEVTLTRLDAKCVSKGELATTMSHVKCFL